MKNILAFLLCFLTGFLFAQPANDNCSGAQNLGNLPTPAACPSGIGTSVNVTGTTIGATPTNPYNYLLGCQTGGNQPAPANDVWYRFVATGNQVNINITGGSPALANPAITLWTGTCGNLTGVGCDNNGTNAGANSAIFEPLTSGQTYYIQVSGSTSTATGNFNLSVNSQNDCSDCLQGSYITATPAPTNGTYPPNTQVTFCYTITSFNQVSANWLHGVIPSFGAGWNPTTLQSVSAPNASAGYIWIWTNGPQGLGWYVDYDPVGPTGPDGNVTNNYGTSNINGTGTWTFCWRITTDPNCTGGTDLSVDVNTTSDGETGNWTSVACQDDPVYQFSSTLICCTNPTVTLSNQTMCQGQSVTLTPTVNPTGGTYSWSSGQVTSSITVTPSTTTSYTVTYATGSCFSTATATVTVNPQTTPTFTQLGPFCSGTSFTLPTTSNNGITGTWSPAINNTSTTTYTFTPTAGQCASTTTMTVTINSLVTPTFTQLGPFCSGTSFTLPTTSSNGISGSWSPAINNTTTTTYTFTPNAGQCANTTTMTITINPLVTPTFTQVGPFCSGTSFTLPTTSNNGISGSWSPAINNTTTTTYTFTPTAGQCASTTTMTVTINPQTVPTFTQVGPFCSGTSFTLPTTSNNGITGTWSPAINNTSTTTYTFTPTAGQCATTATMTVTINPQTVPSFTQLGPFCYGSNFTLPTTSNNGISGTWSPAINNTSTTTYAFTPTAGQCATTSTMVITITPQSTTPTLACYETATWNSTTCQWVVTGTQPPAPTGLLCYQTSTWNPVSCVWDISGTQPPAPTGLLCYQTSTWNPTTCVWDISGTQPPAPTGLLCYETATWNTVTCQWDISGTQPPAPTGLLCYQTANWNSVTCQWDISGAQPPAPTGLLCYQTSTWNGTTCVWDISGTQPPAPTGLACYETATWNSVTCQWDISGTQPPAPTGLLCYQTATWNPATCQWDISGTQPPAPTGLACYETATWNSVTCQWGISGTQPPAPTGLLCYETATWNGTTCVWDISGTQPPAPTGLLCYQTATWNSVTCQWDISGTQPPAPTGLLCYETATWNGTTCVWDISGTQPPAPTGLLCYQTSTWNSTTCQWDITGTQPPAPTGLLCYETATWNSTTCQWDISGTQPPAPTGLLCYETATWNPVICVWDISGTQPPAPTGLLCYQTATWNGTTCQWDISGTQPPAPTGLACYETATWNSVTCQWVVTGTAPSVSISSTPNIINILESSVLTATGSPTGGSYTWSPASSLNTSTGSIVTATPNTTTTYTVVYDIGNNCTSTATTTITVNALTLSVNSTTICSGSSTTLTATPSVIGGSYLWSPGGQTTQSITVSPNTNSIYTCVYTLNGVSTTPTIGTVTVYQTPVVTVTNPTICSGSSSPITATGAPSGGSYVWSNNATTPTINVSPLTTNSYTVTYTSNGCTATVTSTVTVNQTPTINVSSSTICVGQSATVTATPSTSGGLFMWNNSQTTSSITVSPTVTTTYSVMYTLNGCPVTGTGTVTVNPIPTVSVSSSTICLGSSAILTATPSITGGTYSWSGSSSTSNTITVSPNSTTSYSVTYTLNGCSSQNASGTVTVNPIPTVGVNSVVICSNESATLAATPSSPGGTYLWSPNGETTTSITVSPVSTSSYSVVYSLNGCQSSSSSGTVTVNPIPVVSFVSDQLTGCAPLTVQLNNTGSTNGTYSWLINGQNVIGSSIEYTFLQEGCYDIELTTTENGCVNTGIIEDYICVENPPVASFVANPNIFTEPSQIISLTNNTVGGVSYYWNFGDGNSSIDYDPIHTFSNTLNGYTITLTATSELGCVDTYQMTIEYQEDLIFYVPNTFTPDGNEFNNVFQPVFTSGFDANNYHLTIFNRWGEVIFESYDATKGWDGFYNGRMCQDGVYNWKIIFKIPDTDERKIVMGHVVLIR